MALDKILDWASSSESFLHHNFFDNKGFIRLVNYEQCPVPHIEYKVSDKFRYQGIMSKELPKYLETCAKKGYDVLIAVVMSNNIPSIKLLKNNNFVFVKSFGQRESYIWHHGAKKSQTKKMISEVIN